MGLMVKLYPNIEIYFNALLLSLHEACLTSTFSPCHVIGKGNKHSRDTPILAVYTLKSAMEEQAFSFSSDSVLA